MGQPREHCSEYLDTWIAERSAKSRDWGHKSRQKLYKLKQEKDTIAKKESTGIPLSTVYIPAWGRGQGRVGLLQGGGGWGNLRPVHTTAVAPTLRRMEKAEGSRPYIGMGMGLEEVWRRRGGGGCVEWLQAVPGRTDIRRREGGGGRSTDRADRNCVGSGSDWTTAELNAILFYQAVRVRLWNSVLKRTMLGAERVTRRRPRWYPWSKLGHQCCREAGCSST